MVKGSDLARADAPLHVEVLDHFKEQLLIVFLKRLGGTVSIPVAEVDDTGGDLLSFNIVAGVFTFQIEKKQ